MTHGIEESIYKSLMYYFSSNKAIEKVVLFGSRATNMYTPRSDIDLCVSYTGTHKGTIVFEIEDRVGIYAVDVVFQDKLGDNLAKQIQRDGITIYHK